MVPLTAAGPGPKGLWHHETPPFSANISPGVRTFGAPWKFRALLPCKLSVPGLSSRGLCDQRPLNILQLLRRLGVPSIRRSHHQSLQPQRRSFYVSNTRSQCEMTGHWRGTEELPESSPALAWPHLPPPPPRRPLHLGKRAPALAQATGRLPQGCGVLRPSVPQSWTSPAIAPTGPLGQLAFVVGEASRGTPPRPHKTWSPSVTRTPRAPPASGQDAFTSGGWAVPAPPTSLRTSGAQGGPGAGPGQPRELRTRRRNSDRMVGCCPLSTLQPACPHERPSC